MNDHDDRQAQYAFADGYKALVVQKKYMQGSMPEAYGGVSAQVMRVVWRCYADFADWSTGANSYPSHGQVADLTGCSRRQVQRAVQALTDTGWLIKTRESTKTHAAHYTVSLRGMDNTSTHDITSIGDTTPCHLTTRHEVTTRPLGIDNTSTGYRHHDALPYQEPNQEPVEVVSSVSPQQREETTDHQRLFKGGETEESEAVHTRHHQEHTEQPSAIDRIRMLLEDNEQTHRGVWLVAQRIGRRLSEQDARSIAFTLQANTFSADEMMQYLGEKIADHGETPDRLMVRYINADAPGWLLEARERSRVYLAPSYDVKRYTDEERALIEQEEREAEEARQRQVDELMASERGQRYLEEGRRMLEGGMSVDDVLNGITGGRR